MPEVVVLWTSVIPSRDVRRRLFEQRRTAAALRALARKSCRNASSLSTSHAGHLVAVACASGPVGLDIVDPEVAHERLARRFGPTFEVDVVERSSFWTGWAVQEAHLKASKRERLFPFVRWGIDEEGRSGWVDGYRWEMVEIDRLIGVVVLPSPREVHARDVGVLRVVRVAPSSRPLSRSVPPGQPRLPR